MKHAETISRNANIRKDWGCNGEMVIVPDCYPGSQGLNLRLGKKTSPNSTNEKDDHYSFCQHGIHSALSKSNPIVKRTYN